MERLHRQIIVEQLTSQLPDGWVVKSRENGKIVVIPPKGITAQEARAQADTRVRALGYAPDFISEYAGNGDVKLRFTTKETLGQKGQGSTGKPRVASPAMEAKIVAWHQRILDAAIEYKETHPEFTFNLRTGDIAGQDRLKKGYWFTGSNYLFFAPFKPNDQHNKTKSIGFVIKFRHNGESLRSYLEVVFGALRPESLGGLHKKIVDSLGGFTALTPHRYQRTYEIANPLEAFQRFLNIDLPLIRGLIDKSGHSKEFVVPEQQFQAMFETIKAVPSSTPRPKVDGKAKPEPAPSPSDVPINLILYGPPGTGKTYWLKEKFKEYTDEPGVVDHETWMQELLSGYGWRPVLAAAMADLDGNLRVPQIAAHGWLRGKAIQRGRAPGRISQTLWAYLQEHTPPSNANVAYKGRREPYIFDKLKTGEWRLQKDWQEVDSESAELYAALTKGSAAAAGPVKRYRMATFHPSYSYEDFIRGIRPVLSEDSGDAQFRLVDGIFKRICDEARANPSKRYALFIDEINRANIAKVFGELITLIEPDKRARYDSEGTLVSGLVAQLPGGDPEVEDEPFGVPANLDIYGTMNTADRSIALLDIALRRRFKFQEMLPKYDTLSSNTAGINLAELLRRLNDRLEYLLDRDHTIGHAYLIKAHSLDAVRDVFSSQIIPLLQEYFFDDLERLASVVATTANAPPIVQRTQVSYAELFSGQSGDSPTDSRFRYTITDPGTWSADTFKGIYAQ